MLSRHLLPVLLLSLSLCATTINGVDPIKVDCPSERNYTRGDPFDANLHALLSSLPAAAATSSGFAKNSTGALPDQAFGFAQCRADIAVTNASACRACLDAAVRNVTGRCSSRKTALIIYDDCVLRYSDTSFFGTADTSWWGYICNKKNAQPVLFMQGLHELMNNLTGMAAYGTPRMFAAGARELTPYVRLYGMAQCTRDLAGDDCMACLSDAANNITKDCNGKEGGRFYHRSCSVRYEIYSFFDAQDVEAAMSLAMVRPGGAGPTVNGSGVIGPGSTGSNKQTGRTALLVSIPVAVTLFVLLLVVAQYLCNRNRNLHKHAQIASDRHGDGEDDGEMGSVSLLYDLSTLRAATDNFSEENKLGEGGFGPVYKVTSSKIPEKN